MSYASIAPPLTMADDTLEGTAEIAEFIGKSKRQTQYLLETKRLPAYKLGVLWHMRKSRYVRHVEQLEDGTTVAA
jgi:hypothetical protein